MNYLYNSISVVDLKSEQDIKACNVLARAFFDYPFITYLQPDLSKRERNLAWYMGFTIRVGRKYGKILSTPGLEGIVVWLPPEACWISIWRWIQAGILEMPFRLGFEFYARSLANDAFLEDTRHRLASHRHWYLWVIGVDPDYRGKGIGSALLEPILRRADQENETCYLETHLEDNLTWYAKHGFEIVFEGEIPGRDLPVWTMLRRPKIILG